MSQRFPRSLREAFPADRYAAIEVGRRRHLGDRAVAVTAVLAIVALAAMGYWGWI